MGRVGAHNYQRENETKAVNDDQHGHQPMRDAHNHEKQQFWQRYMYRDKMCCAHQQVNWKGPRGFP